MTLQLYLVRHGESQWNQYSRFTGQNDVKLSELGLTQSRRLGERLAGEGITAIYSSPLKRARDTACAIGRFTRIPVIVDAGLIEINQGAWEGLTAPEVQKAYPAEYAHWRTQPYDVVIPHGESLANVERRVETVLSRILAEYHEGKIVVCSHDTVLRVILLQACGFSEDYFFKWGFDNASFSVIQACPDVGANVFRPVQLNETAHLVGVFSDYALLGI